MANRRRTVTGNIQKANAAWPGAPVSFRLYQRGSFTADSHFPVELVTATTDAEGDFSVDLWCDEDGLVATRYGCWLPDAPFRAGRAPAFTFDLGFGDGSDISLETLRATEVVAYEPSAADLLRAVIAAMSFLDFADTPDSYAGKAGYVLRVRLDESGVEFVADPTEGFIAASNFLPLQTTAGLTLLT